MKERGATPFDHRPDAELGAALLAALDAGDPAGFVAGVVARFDSARAPARAWDLLGRWAGRGIAAALVAVVALVLLRQAAAAPVSLDEALVASSDPATSMTSALLVADRPPDPGAVFAAVVGAER
jgi:hypothetical protein